MRTIPKAALASLGATAALIAGTVGSAVADPPTGVTPVRASLVGVGSDTTQSLLDQLSVDYNAKSPKPPRSLYSFDATGTPSITTKAGCAAVTRPNGSGAGIAALKANARPVNDSFDYCVDFARSSRGPQAGDGTSLAFVRYAQDAVTWSATSTPSAPTHAPSSLSRFQLKAIYSCNAALISSRYHGPVTWNEVGGTGTNQIVPVIPQSSSGTRAFFLAAIGVTTIGGCVQGQDNSVEENEGTSAIFSGTGAQDIVFPYSVAVYLAQSQNGHGTGNQGNQVIENVTNTSNQPVSPTVGSAGHLTINPAFATVALTRFLYNVVRDNGTSTHVPTTLQPIFGKGGDGGWVCTDPTSLADIQSFGFRTIGSQCGGVSQPTS